MSLRIPKITSVIKQKFHIAKIMPNILSKNYIVLSYEKQ